jgi:hypothetical protein
VPHRLPRRSLRLQLAVAIGAVWLPGAAFGDTDLPIQWTGGEVEITVCTYQVSIPGIPCATGGGSSGVAQGSVSADLSSTSMWTRDDPSDFRALDLTIDPLPTITLPLTGVAFPGSVVLTFSQLLFQFGVSPPETLLPGSNGSLGGPYGFTGGVSAAISLNNGFQETRSGSGQTICAGCDWPDGGDWFLGTDGRVDITSPGGVELPRFRRDLGYVGGGMFGFGFVVEAVPRAAVVTLVPEPATALLFAMGLVGLRVVRRLSRL